MDAELYAVVCTDLHYALGPFKALGAAVEMAELLTKQTPCTFIPVPMDLMATAEKPDTPERGYGQYL